MPTPLFAAGDRVDGLYDGNSDDVWYPAVIQAVHGPSDDSDEDGAWTFDVLYDDGETEQLVRPVFLRPHEPGTISAGTRVEARYAGGDEWYPGVVENVLEDGTFTIAYDDSEVESGVPLEWIREEVTVRGGEEEEKGEEEREGEEGASDEHPQPQQQEKQEQEEDREEHADEDHTKAHDTGEIEDTQRYNECAAPTETTHEVSQEDTLMEEQGGNTTEPPTAEDQQQHQEKKGEEDQDRKGEGEEEQDELGIPISSQQQHRPAEKEDAKGVDMEEKDDTPANTHTMAARDASPPTAGQSPPHEEESTPAVAWTTPDTEMKPHACVERVTQELVACQSDPVATKNALSTLVKHMRAFPAVAAEVVHNAQGESVLVALLATHQSHAVIQCYGFVLLRRLCFLCSGSASLFLRGHVIDRIAISMRRFAEDAILQAAACGALAVFTRLDSGRRALREHRVAHLVLASLVSHKCYSVHTRQVHYYACEVLLELCELQDETTLEALVGRDADTRDKDSRGGGGDGEPGSDLNELSPLSLLLVLLRQALSFEDRKAACAIAALLLCLCATQRRAAEMVRALNGTVELSTVLTRHPTEPSIARYATAASHELAAVATRNKPLQHAIRESGRESPRVQQSRQPRGARGNKSIATGRRGKPPGIATGYAFDDRAVASVPTSSLAGTSFTRFASPLGKSAPSMPPALAGAQQSMSHSRHPSYGYDHGNGISSGYPFPVGLDGEATSPRARRAKRAIQERVVKDGRQHLLFETYGVDAKAATGGITARSSPSKTSTSSHVLVSQGLDHGHCRVVDHGHGIKRRQLRTHLISASSARRQHDIALEVDTDDDEAFDEDGQVRDGGERALSPSMLRRQQQQQQAQTQRGPRIPTTPVRTALTARGKTENDQEQAPSLFVLSPRTSQKHQDRAGGKKIPTRTQRSQPQAWVAAHPQRIDVDGNGEKSVDANDSEEMSLTAFAAHLFQDDAATQRVQDNESTRLSFAEKLHKMIDKAKSSLALSTTSLPMENQDAGEDQPIETTGQLASKQTTASHTTRKHDNNQEQDAPPRLKPKLKTRDTHVAPRTAQAPSRRSGRKPLTTGVSSSTAGRTSATTIGMTTSAATVTATATTTTTSIPTATTAGTTRASSRSVAPAPTHLANSTGRAPPRTRVERESTKPPSSVSKAAVSSVAKESAKTVSSVAKSVESASANPHGSGGRSQGRVHGGASQSARVAAAAPVSRSSPPKTTRTTKLTRATAPTTSMAVANGNRPSRNHGGSEPSKEDVTKAEAPEVVIKAEAQTREVEPISNTATSEEGNKEKEEQEASVNTGGCDNEGQADATQMSEVESKDANTEKPEVTVTTQTVDAASTSDDADAAPVEADETEMTMTEAAEGYKVVETGAAVVEAAVTAAAPPADLYADAYNDFDDDLDGADEDDDEGTICGGDDVSFGSLMGMTAQVTAVPTFTVAMAEPERLDVEEEPKRETETKKDEEENDTSASEEVGTMATEQEKINVENVEHEDGGIPLTTTVATVSSGGDDGSSAIKVVATELTASGDLHADDDSSAIEVGATAVTKSGDLQDVAEGVDVVAEDENKEKKVVNAGEAGAIEDTVQELNEGVSGGEIHAEDESVLDEQREHDLPLAAEAEVDKAPAFTTQDILDGQHDGIEEQEEEEGEGNIGHVELIKPHFTTECDGEQPGTGSTLMDMLQGSEMVSDQPGVVSPVINEDEPFEEEVVAADTKREHDESEKVAPPSESSLVAVEGTPRDRPENRQTEASYGGDDDFDDDFKAEDEGADEKPKKTEQNETGEESDLTELESEEHDSKPSFATEGFESEARTADEGEVPNRTEKTEATDNLDGMTFEASTRTDTTDANRGPLDRASLIEADDNGREDELSVHPASEADLANELDREGGSENMEGTKSVNEIISVALSEEDTDKQIEQGHEETDSTTLESPPADVECTPRDPPESQRTEGSYGGDDDFDDDFDAEDEEEPLEETKRNHIEKAGETTRLESDAIPATKKIGHAKEEWETTIASDLPDVSCSEENSNAENELVTREAVDGDTEVGSEETIVLSQSPGVLGGIDDTPVESDPSAGREQVTDAACDSTDAELAVKSGDSNEDTQQDEAIDANNHELPLLGIVAKAQTNPEGCAVDSTPTESFPSNVERTPINQSESHELDSPYDGGDDFDVKEGETTEHVNENEDKTVDVFAKENDATVTSGKPTPDVTLEETQVKEEASTIEDGGGEDIKISPVEAMGLLIEPTIMSEDSTLTAGAALIEGETNGTDCSSLASEATYTIPANETVIGGHDDKSESGSNTDTKSLTWLSDRNGEKEGLSEEVPYEMGLPQVESLPTEVEPTPRDRPESRQSEVSEVSYRGEDEFDDEFDAEDEGAKLHEKKGEETTKDAVKKGEEIEEERADDSKVDFESGAMEETESILTAAAVEGKPFSEEGDFETPILDKEEHTLKSEERGEDVSAATTENETVNDSVVVEDSSLEPGKEVGNDKITNELSSAAAMNSDEQAAIEVETTATANITTGKTVDEVNEKLRVEEENETNVDSECVISPSTDIEENKMESESGGMPALPESLVDTMPVPSDDLKSGRSEMSNEYEEDYDSEFNGDDGSQNSTEVDKSAVEKENLEAHNYIADDPMAVELDINNSAGTERGMDSEIDITAALLVESDHLDVAEVEQDAEDNNPVTEEEHGDDVEVMTTQKVEANTEEAAEMEAHLPLEQEQPDAVDRPESRQTEALYMDERFDGTPDLEEVKGREKAGTVPSASMQISNDEATAEEAMGEKDTAAVEEGETSVAGNVAHSDSGRDLPSESFIQVPSVSKSITATDEFIPGARADESGTTCKPEEMADGVIANNAAEIEADTDQPAPDAMTELDAAPVVHPAPVSDEHRERVDDMVTEETAPPSIEEQNTVEGPDMNRTIAVGDEEVETKAEKENQVRTGEASFPGEEDLKGNLFDEHPNRVDDVVAKATAPLLIEEQETNEDQGTNRASTVIYEEVETKAEGENTVQAEEALTGNLGAEGTEEEEQEGEKKGNSPSASEEWRAETESTPRDRSESRQSDVYGDDEDFEDGIDAEVEQVDQVIQREAHDVVIASATLLPIEPFQAVVEVASKPDALMVDEEKQTDTQENGSKKEFGIESTTQNMDEEMETVAEATKEKGSTEETEKEEEVTTESAACNAEAALDGEGDTEISSVAVYTAEESAEQCAMGDVPESQANEIVAPTHEASIDVPAVASYEAEDFDDERKISEAEEDDESKMKVSHAETVDEGGDMMEATSSTIEDKISLEVHLDPCADSVADMTDTETPVQELVMDQMKELPQISDDIENAQPTDRDNETGVTNPPALIEAESAPDEASQEDGNDSNNGTDKPKNEEGATKKETESEQMKAHVQDTERPAVEIPSAEEGNEPTSDDVGIQKPIAKSSECGREPDELYGEQEEAKHKEEDNESAVVEVEEPGSFMSSPSEKEHASVEMENDAPLASSTTEFSDADPLIGVVSVDDSKSAEAEDTSENVIEQESVEKDTHQPSEDKSDETTEHHNEVVNEEEGTRKSDEAEAIVEADTKVDEAVVMLADESDTYADRDAFDETLPSTSNEATAAVEAKSKKEEEDYGADPLLDDLIGADDRSEIMEAFMLLEPNGRPEDGGTVDSDVDKLVVDYSMTGPEAASPVAAVESEAESGMPTEEMVVKADATTVEEDAYGDNDEEFEEEEEEASRASPSAVGGGGEDGIDGSEKVNLAVEDGLTIQTVTGEEGGNNGGSVEYGHDDDEFEEATPRDEEGQPSISTDQPREEENSAASAPPSASDGGEYEFDADDNDDEKEAGPNTEKDPPSAGLSTGSDLEDQTDGEVAPVMPSPMAAPSPAVETDDDEYDAEAEFEAEFEADFEDDEEEEKKDMDNKKVEGVKSHLELEVDADAVEAAAAAAIVAAAEVAATLRPDATPPSSPGRGGGGGGEIKTSGAIATAGAVSDGDPESEYDAEYDENFEEW